MRWAELPIAGFLVGGSSGEAPLLEENELLGLLERARAISPDDLILVAGTGAESTSRAVRLSSRAAAVGADAVLLRAPSFYRGSMSDEALREHFLRVADSSPVPVLLYHVPKYVPVDLASGLVNEVARHDNVAGIKDSSGDLNNLAALVDACGTAASVLVGSGSLFYPALEIGAVGGILAVALLAGADCCDLFSACRSGRGAEAGRLQEKVGKLNKEIVSRHGVPGLKYALDLIGWCGGRPRLPLLPLRDRARVEVETAIRRAGLTTV